MSRQKIFLCSFLAVVIALQLTMPAFATEGLGDDMLSIDVNLTVDVIT